MCILPSILGLLFPQTFCSSASASHRIRGRRRLSYQSQSSSRTTSVNKSNSDNLHFASSSSTAQELVIEKGLFSPTTSSTTRKRSRAIPSRNTFMEEEDLSPKLSPRTQLVDLGGELDYQGQVLSRIVRDIHFQHEVLFKK